VANILILIFKKYLSQFGSYEILYSILEILASVAALFIVIYNAQKNTKLSIRTLEWNLKKNPLSLYILLAFTTIAFYNIAEPIQLLLPKPEELDQYFKNRFPPNVISFMHLVILGPFLEEILFRGIILDNLTKKYSSLKALLWSSLMFGVYHLNPWQFVDGVLAGLFLGWIYVSFNSLPLTILVHIINNLISYILYFIASQSPLTIAPLFNGYLLFFIRLLFFIIGIYIIVKYYKKKASLPTELTKLNE